jgi:ATP-dependent DNA helicase RecG
MININTAQLIENGEGLTVEFKKSTQNLPDNLFETVCAFLNRNGGVILLGVSDDKTICGIDTEYVDSLSKSIANLSNNPQKLSPSFLLESETVTIGDKVVIQLFVPISSQVHNCKGRIFDRSADGDFELKSSEQIKQLYNRKNSLYSENTIYPYLSEDDFEAGLLDRVRKLIRLNRPNHPWNELTNEQFFKASGLYRRDISNGEEGFTMAALLLLGREEVIQSAIPHYKIDALLRKSDVERYDDRENIRCNLVDAYDKLMNFVSKHLPDKFYLEGDQRISLREKIFREIVANMLIHREYTNAFPSTFTIYAERVVTKNANKPHLYGQLLPETFLSFPKNPHLAQLFTQLGRSEELGTGLLNVFNYSKAYSGNGNVIFLEEDIFTVNVPLVGSSITSFEQINEKELEKKLEKKLEKELEKKLTKRQIELINLIKENTKITQKELSGKIGISPQYIRKLMVKLKEKGLIERIGPDKGGYWKV